MVNQAHTNALTTNTRITNVKLRGLYCLLSEPVIECILCMQLFFSVLKIHEIFKNPKDLRGAFRPARESISSPVRSKRYVRKYSVHPATVSPPLQPPPQNLNSLNVRLDDALFQKLVESRWEHERKAASGNGLDCDGFVRLFNTIWTPAISFGRHLRKAAGRGDEELGE